MDTSGRAAVREMRTLSQMRPVMHTLLGVSELVQGINLGFVWIEGGRLVGNVSIYPANIPSSFGKTWIIANVAVHPDYRGRGIARELMRTGMNAIRQRGVAAILQVDADNYVAQRLYDRLGFVRESTWTHWRRSSSLRLPPPVIQRDFYITRRRDNEWRAEMALAANVRASTRGGLGWQRPLHESLFRPSLTKTLNNWINLRSVEHLIVRTEDGKSLRTSLWIESAFATTTIQLTMINGSDQAGLCEEALLNLAIRRYGIRTPLTMEHPTDDEAMRPLLLRYGFHTQRSLLHMRWDTRGQ
jgi:predicted N-acetyltransferase YhbS